MSQKDPRRVREEGRVRIARIQDQIRGVDYICSGTLLKRRKLCGKPGCRCARDPAARHGPYYEWGYLEGGRLVHRMVTAGQAKMLRQAIANYRSIRRLLRHWERQTVRVIDTEKERNR